MYYVIKNNNDVYIKRNLQGQFTTCSKGSEEKFVEAKVKNIFKTLPKTLKRMHFYIKEVQEDEQENTVIEHTDYQLSETIIEWKEKFGECYDILDTASSRYDELEKMLKEYDDETIDILHKIELESSKDMYSAWELYKKLRENRKARRQAKDEMLIIHNVLKSFDKDKVSRERTQKAIDGLFTRKYAYRIADDDL